MVIDLHMVFSILIAGGLGAIMLAIWKPKPQISSVARRKQDYV